MPEQITGQIFFRSAGDQKVPGVNKKLMMFCGAIAVPDDCSFQAEHQYTLVGSNDGLINIIPSSGIDRTEEMKGHSIGGVLQSPIWRV